MRRGLVLPESAPEQPLAFREFIDKVRPGYRWYRHCEILADVLQRVADGRLKRLMIFMPPRHGKSELVSRLFSAYWLYRYPHQWVGVNSYGADLAYGMSRNAKDFHIAGGGSVRGDAAAVKHWETGEGGGMWAAGVGGPILGKGWHLGIIDDPLKNAEESFSEKIRSKQKEWYGSTFYTREEPTSEDDPDGALVIVQQRWHDDDLSGWLLTQETDQDDDDPERWHVVNFEAIKEAETATIPPSCTLEPDWRAVGEALCPERRPIAKLLKIGKKIGAYFFSALFQQRPRDRAGAMFPLGTLKLVDAAPAQMRAKVRYYDTASAGPGKGDWTVGVLMGAGLDGRFYVLSVVRGQWPSDERNAAIKATAESDRARYGDVSIYVERPPGLGKESTEAIIRMLAGFTAYADPVAGDKASRAEPLSAQCRAGNVSIVRGHTPAEQRDVADFLRVVHDFPFAAHDDDVDAAAGAFNRLASAPPPWRLRRAAPEPTEDDDD